VILKSVVELILLLLHDFYSWLDLQTRCFTFILLFVQGVCSSVVLGLACYRLWKCKSRCNAVVFLLHMCNFILWASHCHSISSVMWLYFLPCYVTVSLLLPSSIPPVGEASQKTSWLQSRKRTSILRRGNEWM